MDSQASMKRWLQAAIWCFRACQAWERRNIFQLFFFQEVSFRIYTNWVRDMQVSQISKHILQHTVWEMYDSHPTYMSLSFSFPFTSSLSRYPSFFFFPKIEALWLHLSLSFNESFVLLFAFPCSPFYCVLFNAHHGAVWYVYISYIYRSMSKYTGQVLKSNKNNLINRRMKWSVSSSHDLNAAIHLVMFGVAVDRVDWTEFYMRSVYITTWT